MNYISKKNVIFEKNNTMKTCIDNKLRFMAHNSLLIALLMIITNSSLNAQILETYSNKNYNDKVQTVLLHPTADSLAKPIIHLNDMMGRLHLQIFLVVKGCVCHGIASFKKFTTYHFTSFRTK